MSEGSEHMRLGVNIVAVYLQRGTTRDFMSTMMRAILEESLPFFWVEICIAIF